MDHRTTSKKINTTLTKMFYLQYFGCYTCFTIFAVLYIKNSDLHGAVLEYAMKLINDTDMLLFLIFRLLIACTLSKVATSDTAIELAVHEFKDLTQMSERSKAHFVDVLMSMRQLRAEMAVGGDGKAVEEGGAPGNDLVLAAGGGERASGNPLSREPRKKERAKASQEKQKTTLPPTTLPGPPIPQSDSDERAMTAAISPPVQSGGLNLVLTAASRGGGMEVRKTPGEEDESIV